MWLFSFFKLRMVTTLRSKDVIASNNIILHDSSMDLPSSSDSFLEYELSLSILDDVFIRIELPLSLFIIEKEHPVSSFKFKEFTVSFIFSSGIMLFTLIKIARKTREIWPVLSINAFPINEYFPPGEI